jgi:hypothetical protein
VGKNLLVKQPHPFKTCKMYYLQHNGYNTLAMQVLAATIEDSSSTSVPAPFSLLYSHATTCNTPFMNTLRPKNDAQKSLGIFHGSTTKNHAQ